PVEGREHDRMRGLVDDEVDAGQVLERADVATLAADDPPLHVVGWQLDDGDGRLRGVAGRDALERVGDEVACPPLRLGASLLLEHAHAAGELVARELLAALEQLSPRLLLRHPCDSLELGLLRVLGLLQLLLQPAQVRLAVGEPLVAARELDHLALDLLLLREDTLLDLHHRLAPLGELVVELGAELDDLLSRLDLRLAPERLRLALGVLDDLTAEPSCLADAGGAEQLHRQERDRDPCGDPDGDSDPDQHGRQLLAFADATAVHPASTGCRASQKSLGRERSGAELPGQPYFLGRPRRIEIVVRSVLIAVELFRKNLVCRQNVEWNVLRSYLHSPIVCNLWGPRNVRSTFQGQNVEAAGGQPAWRPPPLGEPVCALQLGLEPVDRLQDV